MGSAPVELVVDARAEVGEGPVWDDRTRRLYWVDILGSVVHVTDPLTGMRLTPESHPTSEMHPIKPTTMSR